MIEEESARRDRLQNIRDKGFDPYPAKASRTHTVSDFISTFKTIKKKEAVALIGRLRTIRKHGGLTFAHLQDGTGKVQLVLHKDQLGEKDYKFFHETIDIGDFIEVHGLPFVTKKGEQSLDINSYRIITKALLPLPEKWHGLSDVETRYRKRFLDLIMNEDVKVRMQMRSRIISSIRKMLDKRGFLEVETPTLQPVYGGGYARPFTTHHNALNTDFYLRISDEMYLKRLLVGGIEKVYEITKVFRNEGIDRDHNPEFTMLEAQIAYEDYQWGMDVFEEIFEYVAKDVLGTTKIQNDDIEINIKRPWKRMKLVEAIEKIAKLKVSKWKTVNGAKNELKSKLPKERHAELHSMKHLGEIIALAFEELVEKELIQPTIIYDYPVEVSPLAKRCKDDPKFVQRFEAFALGTELGNNYSELNDPLDLETRFIEEKKRSKAGFEEAHQTDEEYLEAIKHGMPPSCGLGIGIDRMVMLLTGAGNIKEVILFPTLRLKQ